MPEEMMPEEMGAEAGQPMNMEVERFREGLMRILQSTNIEEIRSIAQELLGGGMEQPAQEQMPPSLQEKLAQSMG